MKKRIFESLSLDGFAALCIAGVLIGAMLICAGSVHLDNNDRTLRAAVNFGSDAGGGLDPANGWEDGHVREAGICGTFFPDDNNVDPDTGWQPDAKKSLHACDT